MYEIAVIIFTHAKKINRKSSIYFLGFFKSLSLLNTAISVFDFSEILQGAQERFSIRNVFRRFLKKCFNFKILKNRGKYGT